MKKYFVFMFSLVVVVTMAFVGCEKKQEAPKPAAPPAMTPPASAPTPTPAPAPAPAPAKPVKK